MNDVDQVLAPLVTDEAPVFQVVDAEVDGVDEQHQPEQQRCWDNNSWQSKSSCNGYAVGASNDGYERQIDNTSAEGIFTGPVFISRHDRWKRISPIVVLGSKSITGDNQTWRWRWVFQGTG